MLWIFPALTRRPNFVTGCHSFSSDFAPPRRGPRRPLPRSPRPLSPLPRAPKPPRPRGAASAMLYDCATDTGVKVVLCSCGRSVDNELACANPINLSWQVRVAVLNFPAKTSSPKAKPYLNPKLCRRFEHSLLERKMNVPSSSSSTN